MKAKLFQVEEVTPGMIEPGRYMFTRGKRIVLELELFESIHPHDLKPLIRAVVGGKVA